jgi:hypothetical protein
MPRPSPSPVRRLALPLGLSVLLHGLGIGLALLLPAALPSSDHPTAVASAGFSVRVTFPRHTNNDLLIPDDEDPVIQVREHPVKIDAPPGAPGATPLISGAGNASAGPSPPTQVAQPASAGRGLLKVPGTARRIVYLIDRSISMGPSGALDAARQEVLASLRALPADARFQVIAYNRFTENLLPGDLVPADAVMIGTATRRLADLEASGGTNHAQALRRALYLNPTPDLIFLVTDADELSPADARAITRLNHGRAVIHVVELSSSGADGADSLMANLAASNGGSHRRVRPIP